MEHLRMNGAYWGLTALDLLGKLDTVDVNQIVSWVLSCQHESGWLRVCLISYSFGEFCFLQCWFVIWWVAFWWCLGGFSGNIGHDPHILYTLSAVQVLALYNKLDVIDADKVAKCILYGIYIVSLLNCFAFSNLFFLCRFFCFLWSVRCSIIQLWC